MKALLLCTDRCAAARQAARLCALAGVIGCATLLSGAAEERPGGGKRGGQPRGDAAADDTRFIFKTDVPAHPLDVVLGRPTRDAVTVSVLAATDREGVIAYGTKAGALAKQTQPFLLKAGEPATITLTGLAPDTRCYYRLATRAGAGSWAAEPEQSFHTARPPGQPFTFTVQADSHLDFGTDPEVYKKSLANVVAARADFHVDLGDTFMTDKYPSYQLAAAQYVAQLYYFGLAAATTPLFLVLGNHDGETLSKGRGPDGELMPVWSNGMRKRYFPNPLPNEFYTGNVTPHPQAGPLEDYYAWTWGDALFIALDQYWYTTKARGGSGDNWNRTLGAEQYAWLKKTLETSRAKYKFLFTHHLVGGETPEGRGGAEASRFFEWGGAELDGTKTFAEKRPGWPAPIHDLCVHYGVSVVFHGHDHLYVRGERDGVVYQLVPQPSHSRYDNTRSAAEYGYKSGVIRGSSGIIRVRVGPEKAVVDYVRAYPAEAESADRKTGSVTETYTLLPRAAQ